MTTWTDIPDADIEPDKPIKSSTAFAFRNNVIALAEGDPTAPSINPSVLLIGGKGGDGPLDDVAPAISQVGYYEFEGMTLSAPRSLPVASIIRINVPEGDTATLDDVLTVPCLSRTVATHDQQRIEAEDFLGALAGADGVDAGGTAGGGGSVGAGGTTTGGGAGGTAKTPASMSRAWVTRRPMLGGNGGLRSGGSAGLEWGPGGGSLILIVEGDLDLTGGEIIADGGHTNDSGGGANQPGGGGGGSILIICTGIITGGTFRARGGNANSGGAGIGGGGGGGWIQLVATAYAGTQTGTVTAGTTNGGGTAATAGLYTRTTLTRDQIRTLLQRL